MAAITRNTFYSHSYSYLTASTILPITLDNNNQSKSSFLLSGSTNNSNRRRASDDYCYSRTRKLRYDIIVGNGLDHYQVCRASKQDHVEGDYEGRGGYKREEFRWLREEQRWLREEQRWLREEAHWNAERDVLLREMSHLNIKIQHLEMELEGVRNRGDTSSTVSETLGRITALLQVLSTNAFPSTSSSSGSNMKQNQIPENSKGNSKALVLEHTQLESKSESQLPIPLPPPSLVSTSKESKKKMTTLRMGAEGEEVLKLQEALLTLGFYCGEEDMEFSSFSGSTQCAVKTWQASNDIPEDGVMPAELLEMLFASLSIHSSAEQDKTNEVPTVSVKEVSEAQQTVVKKDSSDDDITQHRVFLLGENRWEEPSRLTKKNDKHVNGITSQTSSTKCLVCQGEGHMLCMECDGTGEPNVEEQFLDWVEGAKCPYCEGRGHNVCDVCNGKAVA